MVQEIRGSIPGRVIPKTLKMVLDTSLLNTQQYKVRIEGKVEQSRERSSTLLLYLDVVAIEKGASWSPSIKGRQLYLTYYLLFTFYLLMHHLFTFLFIHSPYITRPLRQKSYKIFLSRIFYYIYIYIFTNPSTQAGYDTRSIFKQSLTGLNSDFSFS